MENNFRNNADAFDLTEIRSVILRLVNVEIYDKVCKIETGESNHLKVDIKKESSEQFNYFYDFQHSVYTRLTFDITPAFLQDVRQVLELEGILEIRDGISDFTRINNELIEEENNRKKDDCTQTKDAHNYFQNLVRQRENSKINNVFSR